MRELGEAGPTSGAQKGADRYVYLVRRSPGDSQQYHLGMDPEIPRHKFVTGSEVSEIVAIPGADGVSELSVIRA